MRIYANAYELMSEMGRNLWEMGSEVKPKSYQNKDIQGNDDFITKELICEQYCLTKLPDPECLFVFSDTKDWADEEFKERILPTMTSVNPGEAWKLREEVWTEFLNNDNMFDYTYHDRINKRLLINIENSIKAYRSISIIDNVIRELKRNPDTRQAIIPIFNSKDVGGIGGAFRIPCSMYYDFLVRNNARGEKQLNICYHQRSSDFVTHFGNDVYLAWRLMEYIANQIEVKPGYLYHTLDSIHSYKKDWVKLKTSLGDQLR